VALDVEMLTVGQIAENTFLLRPAGGDKLLVVDPGDEAERILAAIEATGAEVEAILLTHTHFDHIGAVAPVARATGAPVYVPEIEKPVLADIMAYVPWEGFGPFESYDADETLVGGEDAIFSGDVLFQGSVGRVDLPGGDWPTLADSIARLLDSHGDETVVHPGHMGLTTLGAERATNPFLQASAR
jgi:hydroxyacylglutathione hydrolase